MGHNAHLILLVALTLAAPAIAETCVPVDWDASDYNCNLYIPGLLSQDCAVQVKNSRSAMSSYSSDDFDLANDFWVTYKNASRLWVNTDRCKFVDTGFIDISVQLDISMVYPGPPNTHGFTTFLANSRGMVSGAGIKSYVDAEVIYNRSRIAMCVMHEMLHPIGLKDVSTPGAIMMGSFSEDEFLTDANVASITCVYGTNVCVESYSPVLFEQILCETQEDQKAVLTVTTHREDNVRALRILRSVDFPTCYSQYAQVAEIPLINPNGGKYVWEDPGETAWFYAIEVEESDGSISGVLFVQKTDTDTYSFAFPASTIDQIRAENAAGIQFTYWKSVASGTIAPPTISIIPSACDVLVVCYRDFANDLAAIADYWQGQGLRVRMVTCDAVASFGSVRACIAAHNALHELDAVWLVGASAGTPSDSRYYELVPSEDDTFDFRYGDIDDDGFVEVPVGRLPAASRSQVVVYVGKELRYHRDTLWGGKKPMSRYGDVQVNIVPAVHAADEEKYAWTPAQYSVGSAGSAVYEALAGQLGYERVHGFLSTQLFEWQFGDDATYAEALWGRVSSDLAQGRHLIFGVALHNSESAQYGVVAGNRWQTRARDPVEEFWIMPECYSNSYSALMRIDSAEPVVTPSYLVPIYELFIGEGLAIVGSSGVAAHDVTASVTTKWAERILVEDEVFGHARPLGQLWKDIINDVRGEYPVMPQGLCNYCIFGDPMLYVRGVYDDGVVGLDGGRALSPTLAISPNPGNGRIVFRMDNVANMSCRLELFDLAGRKVWESAEAPDAESTRRIVWGGLDNRGRAVASGKYLVRVAAGKEVLRGTVVYVK